MITTYIDNGCILTPLQGKIPLRSNWQKLQLSKNDLEKHKGNFGWVLGSNDLIIDVDVRNGGLESFSKLEKDLDYEFVKTVTTPTGGFHIYLRVDDNDVKPFFKTLKNYEGIDFLTKGSQVVIVGSKTEQGEYAWVNELNQEFINFKAPKNLLRLITKDSTDSNRESSFMHSYEEVETMLNKLDPSMLNDEWVKVGMALHDWSPEQGFALWEKWSQGGSNYKKGETAKRWKSFSHTPSGVGFGSLVYMVKANDHKDAKAKVDRFIEDIKSADLISINMDIIPKIQYETFDTVYSEMLLKALRDRMKTLTNVTVPIQQLRNDVFGSVTPPDDRQPSWVDDWVYCNALNVFVDLKKLTLHKSEAFNLINGKYIQSNAKGGKMLASKYVADNGLIEVVDNLTYSPQEPQGVITKGGVKYLNVFSTQTLPKPAKEFTTNGLKAIELFRNHIKFICTTEENAEIFTQWLAHQIQFMGVKIKWSPIIQSIEGMGKSYFGEVLKGCLGQPNVGIVAPTQVVSNFNGWADKKLVNILEELRVQGHNRYEAVNALKPLITDPHVQINEKNQRACVINNTCNYLCFTNYKDCLPIGSDDRRWWVIFVPVRDKSELVEYVNKPAYEYFPELYDMTRTYMSEIHKWLLQYPITSKFKRLQYAPDTIEKLSMAQSELLNIEGLEEVMTTINEVKGDYWDTECVSATALFQYIGSTYPELKLSTRAKSGILRRLGYMPHMGNKTSRIRIDGKLHRFYTLKPTDDEKIREKFLIV